MNLSIPEYEEQDYNKHNIHQQGDTGAYHEPFHKFGLLLPAEMNDGRDYVDELGKSDYE